MAAPTSRPRRALAVLTAALLALFAAIAATVQFGEPRGQWTPRLGLDLEGGTTITLQVRASDASRVNDGSIAQAVEIIRQRVDSFGVAEAEVTSQGSGAASSILISIPGRQGGDTLALVRQTAELRFRRVLVETGPTPTPPQPAPGQVPAPSGSGVPSPDAGQSPGGPSATATVAPRTPAISASPTPDATPDSTASASPSANPSPSSPSGAPSTTAAGRVVPMHLLAAQTSAPASAPAPAPTPSEPAASVPAPAPSGVPAPVPAQPAPNPAQPAPDPAQPAPNPAQPAPEADPLAGVPPQVLEQFERLDCTQAAARRGGGGDDPAAPIAACERDGQAKYILGPAEVLGTDVSGADAGLETNSQGQAIAGQWQVNLSFTGEGSRKWADLTTDTVGEQVAIVLDGLVVSAPQIREAITGGQAQISGGFDQQSATDLANVLRYGALPLTFDAGEAREISPTLGSDQLRAGLLAGGLGLLLVVVYSMLYYRVLGVVNVASLAVSTLFSYGAMVLASNMIGLRLSLAGVAGFVVGIGVAADSFIVYFERIRDELRLGRTLRVAVESSWRSARRTILAADFVSLLAAAVLYVLSVGAVRGFAFTLGLATIIDILVVFLFTKPLVTLLARTRYFSRGGRWSGFSVDQVITPPRRPALRRPRAPVTARTATRSANGATLLQTPPTLPGAAQEVRP